LAAQRKEGRYEVAILRSVDGKFFEVPDDELENFEVPPEKVKQVLEELDSMEGPEMAGPVQGGGGQSPQVVVQVSGGTAAVNQGEPIGAGEGEGGGVQPYRRHRRRWWWYNYWSNCWRNCWRNCY
jgi:hypothetical protein